MGAKGSKEGAGLTDEERRRDMLACFEKFAKAGGFREKVKHLTTQEIASLDPKTYVLVDVRPDELRKVSHIPGSITQAEFEQERDGNAGAYDGKTVITSCTIGYKSGLFAKELAAKCPSLEVRNHVGSIMDWCHEGKDLVDEKGKKTKKVHGFGKDFVRYFPHNKGLEFVLDCPTWPTWPDSFDSKSSRSFESND